MRNFLHLIGWKSYLTSIILGVVLTFSLPPYNLFILPFIIFPLFFCLLDLQYNYALKQPKRQLFIKFMLNGYFFGLGYFTAGLWWIGEALLNSDPSLLWLLPFAVFGLPLILSIYYAIAAGICSLAWHNNWAKLLIFTFSFSLIEYLRAILLTGFPWNSLGYLLLSSDIILQSIPITGLYGMNIITIFICSLPYLFFKQQTKVAAIILFIITLAMLFSWGSYRLYNAPPIEKELAEATTKVRIVQASIPQTIKWDTDYADSSLNSYLELSQLPYNGRKADIIVWPETAVPYLVTPYSPLLNTLGSILDGNQLLATGAIRGDFVHSDELESFNSILLIDKDGIVVDSADKEHLVPFGEYIPFYNLIAKLGITDWMPLPAGLKSGQQINPLMTPNGHKILPLICYEAIFPTLGANLANKVDFILNVSNDAWYGDTPGPYQHLLQARVHSVNNGLSLVRAANNGISIISDPYGRIIKYLSYNEINLIDSMVPKPIKLPFNKVITWQVFLCLMIINLLTLFIFAKANKKIDNKK